MSLEGKKEAWVLSAVFGLIAISILFDVAMDLSSGGSVSHVGIEIFLVALSLLGLSWIWTSRIRQMKARIMVSETRLKNLEEESERWKRQIAPVRPGLSAAIDRQFLSWQLTPAEQEIARLILKGLTNKEIASLRESTEQTIKQQTNAIYRKSGLASRAQLSAFFLEDLF